MNIFVSNLVFLLGLLSLGAGAIVVFKESTVFAGVVNIFLLVMFVPWAVLFLTSFLINDSSKVAIISILLTYPIAYIISYYLHSSSGSIWWNLLPFASLIFIIQYVFFS